MKKNMDKEKEDFMKLIFFSLENINEAEETTDYYLKALGKEPDKIAEEGLKKIKQHMMKIKAKAVENAMEKGKSLHERAKEKARIIMSSDNFELKRFLNERSCALQFRNFEKTTKEDEMSTVEKILYLEMLNEKEEK